MVKELLPIPQDAETKSSPFALFKADKIKGERTRAGIFAVMGNRDSIGDRMFPGAFAKTWAEGRRNIVHLWDHGESGQTIPTASIDDLYEIGKSDLPEEVLEHSPDATGAAVVVRTYLKSPVGDHFLAAVDSGAIKQMSFAYAIPKDKASYYEEIVNGEKVQTRGIREVKQYDTSDVRWGCNGATIAQIKSLFQRPVLEFDALVKAIQEMDEQKRAELLSLLAPEQKTSPVVADEDFSFKLAFARLQSLHAIQQPSR